MSAAGRFLRRTERGYEFWCPGCGEGHHVTVNPGWTFDGNLEAPTFDHSVLVRSGHFSERFSGQCWCTYNAENPDNPSRFRCRRCHSFVRAGQIQFLGDCSHALAGQTVPLPEWPQGVE